MHADSGRQSALTPPRAAPPRPCRLCLAVAGVTAARRAFHADPHTRSHAHDQTPKHDRAVTARCAPKTKWEVTNGASCCWHLKSYSLSTVKREVPVGPRVRRAGARRTGLLWPPILGIERARLEGRGRLAQAGFESTAAEPSRSQREREREGEREERSFSLSSGGASIPHATHQRRKLTVGSDDDGRGFRRLEVAMFAKVEALHRA